ncbi:alkaline phosphatase domain-containing protein [Candidatus Magnetoovum chiemensis]|nr:alkaline phosphatase domain-containing protein [Candidatus Magnetoovum chiemensis]
MASCREYILSNFIEQDENLFIVYDPDGLLSEEGVISGLKASNIDVVEYEDSISFRYVYETIYREKWDNGIVARLAIVVRCSELESIPYDIINKGTRLSFSLCNICPYLTYSVSRTLETKYLETLFQAQNIYLSEPLGINSTIDFIIRHVFEIAPELINRF